MNKETTNTPNKNKEVEIPSILEILTTNFRIEEIYLNPYDRDEQPYDLVILVSDKYVRTLGELVPQIRAKLTEYPKYRILCYVSFQATEKIREGNLFLYTGCRPECLIYKKEDSVFSPIHKKFDLQNCLALARESWDRENKKIDEFYQGYYFLIDQQYHSAAAFMLHQVMELTYRALEIVLVAKEKVTHSIRCHHRHLNSICSLYHGIFDEDEHVDIELLHTLEMIYRSTRYEDSFQVELHTLEQLKGKMDALRKLASEIFDHMIDKCANHPESRQEKVLPVGKSHTPDLLPEEPLTLESILAMVHQGISGNTLIYIFGQRQQSIHIQKSITAGHNAEVVTFIDLLIMTDRDQRSSVSSLQARINQMNGPKVCMISYTKDQVQRLLDSNNPFLHRVITCGRYASEEETNEQDIWNLHPDRGERSDEEVVKATRNWEFRYRNSKSFLQAARAIEQCDQLLVKIYLYNQTLEQACLGILDFIPGFIPYQYNLNHLLNMCCSFWNFPTEIFPRDTLEEKIFFRNLQDAIKDTRYRRDSALDLPDAYRYDVRCELFLEMCEGLVAEHSAIRKKSKGE